MLATAYPRLASVLPRPSAHHIARRWMSVRPAIEDPAGGANAPRKKVTIQTLNRLRKNGSPIAMLTAYDFPTGRATDVHGADVTLVGDSLAQTCLGYESTTQLTMDEMVHHCAAVRRGCRAPLLVADMPFGSYGVRVSDAVENAMQLMKQAGAEGVKLEGGVELVETVRAMTSAGVPVMAHVGLLPQRHAAMSGYKVQAKDACAARATLRSALALEEAGAFSIVLEAIPSELGAHITERLRIPTIGIGAGPGTSGQVLVWSDVMGTWHGHKAKFVRRFADVQAEARRGVVGFVDAVRTRSFPDSATEGYEMGPGEWERFLELEEKVPTVAP